MNYASNFDEIKIIVEFVHNGHWYLEGQKLTKFITVNHAFYTHTSYTKSE